MEYDNDEPQTHEEANEHIHNGRHSAHRRKGLVAHIVANHPAVHHIIHLLEKAACQQGQGKGYDMSRGTAVGHVPQPAARLFHGKHLRVL